MEHLLLMELCTGGHVVDLMNQRLPDRFHEKEVLKILCDVIEALAHMHSQTPPIVHRDLKPENVLIAGGHFKLCDFGSATTKTLTPGDGCTTGDAEEEIGKFTTLPYRAPEMVDL